MKSTHLQRSSDDFWDIAVSDSLGGGIYLRSCSMQGQFLIFQFPFLGRSFEVVIEKFRLADLKLT